MRTVTIDRNDWLYGENGGQLVSEDGCCIVGHLAEALGVGRDVMMDENLLSEIHVDGRKVEDHGLYQRLVDCETELEMLNDGPARRRDRETSIMAKARRIGFDVRFTGMQEER